MDNNGIDAGDPNRTPRSNPTIYNVTCVGKQQPFYYTGGTMPPTCRLQGTSRNCVNQAFLFRQNTAGTMRNAIAYHYATGLDFDRPSGSAGGGLQPDNGGLCTQIAAAPPPPGGLTGLSFRNGIISLGPVAPLPGGTTGTISTAGDADPSDPDAGGGVCAGYTMTGGANLEALYIANPDNAITVFTNGDAAGDFLMNPFDVMAPDFRPKPGSAPTTVAIAPNPGLVNGATFETTNYVGAVAPANSSGSNIPWYAGWTRGWTTPTTK
jgi:hypothetical protein